MNAFRWRLSASRAACLALAICLMTLATSGCGGKPETTDNGAEPEVLSVKRIAVDSLPPLDEYLPPLDGQRVELAPPAKWKWLSPDKYLVRFVKTDALSLPRILVTAEESKLAGVQTVTADNVGEFAKLLSAELENKPTKLIEQVRPMVIGKNAYARYVIGGKMGEGKSIERQILKTVFEGRMYTIDLQVAKDEIRDHRDAAYAVAAGAKFTSQPPAAPPPAAPPPDKPAAPESPPATP